jgi:hypothetical protein
MNTATQKDSSTEQTSLYFIVADFEIANPDGIHIRPAHVITVFAQELSEHGVLMYLKDGSNWRNVVEEHEMAINGYGTLYRAFIKQCLVQGSNMTIMFKTDLANCDLSVVNSIFNQLLNDIELLENGGVSFETEDFSATFTEKYLDRIHSAFTIDYYSSKLLIDT